MLVASEAEILEVFRAVHGNLGKNCRAEVMHDEDNLDAIIGVACMKDGRECWHATLTELMLDLLIRRGLHNE